MEAMRGSTDDATSIPPTTAPPPTPDVVFLTSPFLNRLGHQLPTTPSPPPVDIPSSIGSRDSQASPRWSSDSPDGTPADGHERGPQNFEGRLLTFRLKRWPKTHVIHPNDLAQAGFYYTGQGDTVKCAFCYGALRDWRYGERPMVEHCRHFPRCSFVLGANASPRHHHSTSSATSSSPRDFDVAGSRTGDPTLPSSSTLPNLLYTSTNANVPVTQTTTAPGDRAVSQNLSHQQQRTPSQTDGDKELLESMGIFTRIPSCNEMSSYQARLQTFSHGWPSAIVTQTPDDLALAGFYFCGTEDKVKCFSCDGGLKNWLPNDLPFEEHAKWYSDCDYVRFCKGDAYIVAAKMGKAKCLDACSPTSETVTPMNFEQMSGKLSELGDISQLLRAKDMGYNESIILAAVKSNGDHLFSSIDRLVSRIEALKVPGSVREESNESGVSVGDGWHEETEDGDEIATAGRIAGKPSSRMSAEDRRNCKICMDEEISVVILPCGHFCCCPTCAPALTQCPICRKEILGLVRTFMA